MTLTLAAPVHAGDEALAESLFREGKALMEAGDYAAACPRLEESYAQDPATGTLLALAFCQEELGQTASAWTSFGTAAARAKREGSATREQAARERQAALEPKLSRLKVTVGEEAANIDGLVVKRDGTPMGRGAWGAAAAIDPGKHVIEASAPGMRPWRTTVTVGANADRQEVEVPVLQADEPNAISETAHAGVEADADAASDAGDARPLPLTTIGLITGGVGLAGLGVGGYFGLRAMSLDDESNDDCDASNVCGRTGGEKRDDAGTAADVATVAFIAGGVLVGTGLTLFLVGASQDAETGEHVRATPVFGRNQAAVFIDGRF